MYSGADTRGVQWHRCTPFSVNHTGGVVARDFSKLLKQVRIPPSLPLHALLQVLSPPIPSPFRTHHHHYLRLCQWWEWGGRELQSHFCPLQLSCVELGSARDSSSSRQV